MYKLQLFVTVMTLAMLLLSGCASQPLSPPDTVPVAVTETVTPVDLTGTWRLDGKKTEAGMTGNTLLGLYGTGIHEGAELVLNSDGTIRYFIGISQGGEGTYTCNGSTISAEINPYQVDSLTTFPLTLQVLEEDGVTYLTMEDCGESIYWTKEG